MLPQPRDELRIRPPRAFSAGNDQQVRRPGLAGVAQVIDVRPARFEQVLYTVGTDPIGLADTLTSIALRYGTTVAGLATLNPQLTSATLTAGAQLVVARGIRPAQLALLSPDVPQTLLLRSIP